MNTLLIGATSALCQALAKALAAQGHRLYLIARNGQKLQSLAQELGDAVVGTTQADLNAFQDAESLVNQAIQALGGLDHAVIAHGFLGDQIETEADWAQAQGVLGVNLLSPVALLIPIANHMESQGKGHITVCSSVAGERGRPRNYTYGAAKSALTTYCQGIRTRLYKKGVRVHVLKLGPIDTPMTLHHKKNPTFTTPEALAPQIARIMESERGDVYLPWYWGPIMAVVTRMPEPVILKFPFLSGR